jgi:hypothetical protein
MANRAGAIKRRRPARRRGDPCARGYSGAASALAKAGIVPYLAGREDVRCDRCGRSSGVERNLAKVEVEGSNPFARSSCSKRMQGFSTAAARRLRCLSLIGDQHRPCPDQRDAEPVRPGQRLARNTTSNITTSPTLVHSTPPTRCCGSARALRTGPAPPRRPTRGRRARRGRPGPAGKAGPCPARMPRRW